MKAFTGDIDGARAREYSSVQFVVKTSLRAASVAIFIFGAILFIQANKNASAVRAIVQSVDVGDAAPAQPFIVEYISTSIGTDGTVSVTGRTTRYVKADGEWRLVMRRNIGKPGEPEEWRETRVYAATDGNVYQREHHAESRSYVSASDDQSTLRAYRSSNYLRNHREFIRTDEVAGLEVYVFRVEISDAPPGNWIETSYSPRTGITPLRTVRHSSDGSETRQEAIAVEFKMIPEDLNNDVKALPIRSKEK